MQIRNLVISLAALSLVSSAWADQYQELAAKGYRWVAVNGPYACATEQEVRQVTGDPTDAMQLHMIEDSGAYYLIRGAIGKVIKNDPVNGMSEILLGGITRPLWTYTKYLTSEPIHDTYGMIETPQISGLIDPSDAEGVQVPDFGASQAPHAPESRDALPDAKTP
jgi:hypothetical protein